MIDLKPRALAFIQRNGPVLPLQVAKEIGRDSFLASAILSELVHSQKIKLTNSKVGGSPLYYMVGQEPKLGRLYNHLNQREKEAYDLLKKYMVLEDSKLKPVERVALSEIKDFAFQIEVKIDENITRFWKWYLLPDEEAKERIKEILGIKEEQQELKEQQEPVPIIIKEEPVIKEEPKLVIEEKPKILEEKPIEEIKKIEEQKPTKKIRKVSKKLEKEQDLMDLIDKYCKHHEIQVSSKKIIKANKEIEMLAKVSTRIGDMNFFVKVLNKKKITNADLSLAYSEAQHIGFPVLFLTTGDSNKKTEEFIEKKLRNQLIFKKIG